MDLRVFLLNMVDMYFMLEEQDKAMDLAVRMKESLMEAVCFYIDFYEYTRSYFEETVHQLFVLSDIMKQNGFEDEGEEIVTSLNTLVEQYS